MVGGYTPVGGRAAVVARLRARQPEIEQAISALVRERASGCGGVEDAEYVAGQRETIAAVVEYGLAGLDLGEMSPVPVPGVVIEQARRAVHLGVSLETVLGRYVAGYRLFGELIMREAGDLSGEVDALVFVCGLHPLLLERVVSSIAWEYANAVA